MELQVQCTHLSSAKYECVWLALYFDNVYKYELNIHKYKHYLHKTCIINLDLIHKRSSKLDIR